jgi:tRNA threonylcarbamoyladenosine biosynthesis protein TsaE
LGHSDNRYGGEFKSLVIGLMQKQFLTHSAEETIELGRTLAPRLRDASIVLLRGDLGSGKTTVVKGIAEAFEAAEQEDVASPTFTLVHEYRGPERSLFHIDLYRIETLRELETLGLDDLIREEGNILLIEWGEKFERLLRERDVEIAIERIGDEDRRFTIDQRPSDKTRRPPTVVQR